MQRTIHASTLANEIVFSASRSSGAGGQNVNKVNTKITINFDVKNSQYLRDEEKETILKKLATRLTKDGVLILSSQENRSQLQNKETVILKLEKLIAKAFEKRKPRRPTKPSRGSVEVRITEKKQRSEKKQWRQKL